MNKKRQRFFLKALMYVGVALLVFFIYFICAIYISTPEIADRSSEKQEVKIINSNFRALGNNWLKKSESGLYELYVEGDAFERGVANGKLTKELAEYQETVFINQIKQLIPSESYLNFLKYFVAFFNRNITHHITEEYLQEIYGVSLSATDKYDNIAPKYYRILNYHSAHDIGHALQDKNMTVGCTSFGVSNTKTQDGKLLLGRNFDFFAGEDFAKNKIVCFTKPKTGNKFMYVTWAGFTGVVSGMNDKGLTVTLNAAKSDIPSSAATPISLLAKEILQYASNIQQADSIARLRKTFVSEALLIGSAQDKKAAIIEKTPSRINLYSQSGDEIICSNHYGSPEFLQDYINDKNMIESASLYRYFRMKQVLQNENPITPEGAAAVLRNQQGINNTNIGLTNEKAINQLISHHSIIFKPEEQLVWVSTSPLQLGKYVCYDLKKVFKEAATLSENKELQDVSRTIPADTFLTSAGYKNFLLFKQLKHYIQYCTKSKYNLFVEEKFLQAFEKSNPENYFTYWIIADYFAKQKENKKAILFYNKALSKEVASLKEARQIKEQIAELSKHD